MDRIADPEYFGSLDSEGVLDLVRLATGDEAMAQKAATERARARIDAGLPA